jgi:hypothetical protein
MKEIYNTYVMYRHLTAFCAFLLYILVLYF